MMDRNENIRLVVPDEQLVAADMKIDGKPYVGVLNKGLLGFRHKAVFGWYLSLIIEYDHTVGEGMPDEDDSRKMQNFADVLAKNLECDPVHPNSLFLGRVTGDGCTQIMWYVNNPETADEYLRELIRSKEYPLEFDYEMSLDVDWQEAAYWLKALAGE